MPKTVREYYHEKQHECDAEIKRFERQINIYSFLRLFVLIAGIFLFYKSISYNLIWLSFLLVFLLILGFAWLVARQLRFQKQVDYFRNLSMVHSNELNSLDRKQNIYSEGSVFIDDLHPYSSDLDIFGKGSLFGMINRSATNGGIVKLAAWLNEPASKAVIRERQFAVIELGANLIWKHHFQAVLLFANKAAEDQSAELFKFLNISIDKSASWLIVYVRWIPFIFLITAIGSWFIPSLLILLSVLIVFNLILTQQYHSRVLKTDSMIGKMSRILNHFAEAISAVMDENWKSAMCRQLKEDLKGKEKLKLSEQIKRFSLLISHLTFGLTAVGGILNVVMLWNIRQLFAIENWKK
ncbi:MAG TPA: hypothetical protein VGE44_03515, partial [Daejeonella sp.]|uniref:hypothetical protein n=1 Tax=Daejeonella sp. TaxID=2805397 RepID=UPI002ED7A2BB